jgi:hypothetical protein
MPDRETYLALIAWHIRIGYEWSTARRLAHWCLDPSQPAPGWTHKEQKQ